MQNSHSRGRILCIVHAALTAAFRPSRLQTTVPRTRPLSVLQFAKCYSAGTAAHSRRGHGQEEPGVGTDASVPHDAPLQHSASSFYFEAGYALFAKRPSRPFPPPFMSLPPGRFSDTPSTHDKSREARPVAVVNRETIRGITNGDDAVLVSDNFIGANDGVGAWATRDRGHSALWSRLILHFWALEAERDAYGASSEPDPVSYLQRAYECTKTSTSEPNEWFGTTTASGALISHDPDKPTHPMVYVTQLGDSQVMILRPRSREILFKTVEQWHWFDCPRQLGTNSPDTPKNNAVLDRVSVEEDDVVLAMSDGVVDNIWGHEILNSVCDSLDKWDKWRNGESEALSKQGVEPGERTPADKMKFVATEVVKAARVIAEDPYAESPYMERAVEEGLSIEGGKPDDISVVAAQCKRRKG